MSHFIELFSSGQTYISLLTLTFLEIVLGIDNIIFLSIVTGRVERSHRQRARTVGLSLALFFRILLLLGISCIARLTQPLFELFGFGMSGRDLILLGGGLFLVAKSTVEIHQRIEGPEEESGAAKSARFWAVIWQIVVLDVVFSFDSVITAVGLVQEVSLMILAVILSLFVMLAFSGMISDFINRYPTLKMLALSFILMIGMLLFAEAFHFHVPRGYAYFAMLFSLFVELLNIKMHRRQAARS